MNVPDFQGFSFWAVFAFAGGLPQMPHFSDCSWTGMDQNAKKCNFRLDKIGKMVTIHTVGRSGKIKKIGKICKFAESAHIDTSSG